MAVLFCLFAGLPAYSLDVVLRTPDKLKQGDPLLCVLRAAAPLRGAAATLADARGAEISAAPGFFLPGEGSDSNYMFLLAVPRAAHPGIATLTISGQAASSGDRVEVKARISIEETPFAREDIPLDPANTALRTAPDPAKDAESAAFARIFELRDPTALFASGPMLRPIAASWRITSGYSDERRYLYASGGSESSYHGGIDLGAPRGTPVLACASGRVVFSGPRIVTGNTIVLEHLPGLFSLYMHLDSLSVQEGQLVLRGQTLGEVGSTGLSTGPHLHWELRIGARSVNPLYWLTTPLLDKAP